MGGSFNPEGGGLLPEWGHVPASYRSVSSLVAFSRWLHGQVPFTSFSTAVHSRFDAQPFRALLLRLCARNCRVAVHSTLVASTVELVAGVLVRRGFVVESASLS